MNRGFTLIELVVCIAIFAMMTALVIAKYGTFNQSVLLTDLAYDTAITVRTAQTYGIGVQQASNFQSAYGVDFCASAGGCGAIANDQLTLFADTNGSVGNGVYDAGDISESLYTITRGAIVAGFCLVSSGCSGSYGTDNNTSDPTTRLDVTFKRPNPDAIICVNGNPCPTPNQAQPYAAVIIKGTDGSTRQVIIRNTGQVSVQE